jgi:predicted transglutaminase-like cysteine proteinase
VRAHSTTDQPNNQDISGICAERALAGDRVPNTPHRRGFIRRVSGTFRTYRLGDLMVAAGLLTEDQLKQALALQSARRQPLGRILVEEGYVSAVQLYRKLGEQWCIKTSAAGVAFMLQTFTPAAARADDGGTAVRLAAAFSPAASQPAQKKLDRPKLFGSTEIRSNDISSFTKWTTVMARFEQQMKSSGGDPQMQAWKAQLQSLSGASPRDKVAAVNSYINQISYVEDSKNYGQSDYWATPVEFFRKGGDCEDFAIAKYASLRALGFSTEQLRIAIVQDKIKNIAHAILIVYTEDGTYVLDNQDKRLRHAAEVTRYQPVFSINATNWWLHRLPAGASS